MFKFVLRPLFGILLLNLVVFAGSSQALDNITVVNFVYEGSCDESRMTMYGEIIGEFFGGDVYDDDENELDVYIVRLVDPDGNSAHPASGDSRAPETAAFRVFSHPTGGTQDSIEFRFYSPTEAQSTYTIEIYEARNTRFERNNAFGEPGDLLVSQPIEINCDIEAQGHLVNSDELNVYCASDGGFEVWDMDEGEERLAFRLSRQLVNLTIRRAADTGFEVRVNGPRGTGLLISPEQQMQVILENEDDSISFPFNPELCFELAEDG